MCMYGCRCQLATAFKPRTFDTVMTPGMIIMTVSCVLVGSVRKYGKTF